MHIDSIVILLFFFFNDTATTEIYTLSLHDALPIFTFRLTLILWISCSEPRTRSSVAPPWSRLLAAATSCPSAANASKRGARRSEEHTSELQSRQYLVCRLLLEKKKNIDLVNYVIHR